MSNDVFIHPSAEVDKRSKIGMGSKIWNNVQIREGAKIGERCILSKDVYIDTGVVLGNRCKVQNGVSVYNGVTVEDDVFIGPHATLTNDKVPRAFNNAWKITPTLIKAGSSIGANATIVCGITIGNYAMVAAGSVVTKSIPSHALVMGNPAKIVGYVCKCGNKIDTQGYCAECGASTNLHLPRGSQ